MLSSIALLQDRYPRKVIERLVSTENWEENHSKRELLEMERELYGWLELVTYYVQPLAQVLLSPSPSPASAGEGEGDEPYNFPQIASSNSPLLWLYHHLTEIARTIDVVSKLRGSQEEPVIDPILITLIPLVKGFTDKFVPGFKQHFREMVEGRDK